MKSGSRLTIIATARHKAVTTVMVVVTVLIALAAGLPSLFPGTMGFMNALQVDTDPENMLSPDEPVRLFHHEMKSKFSLYDIVVVGVVNEGNPNGVFNVESLRKIHELTGFAAKLTGDTRQGREAGLNEGEGVIGPDIIAPSTVDNIQPAGNAVKFEWLMRQPPQTPEQAGRVLENAQRIPFFRGLMVPPKVGDGHAVCIYLPISSKDISYKIYRALKRKIAELGGPEKYYITGLPVAEDTFGVEMFIQMAISAPVAMVIIFLLMLVFFRKFVLVISPMIVALVSVVFTMGALIIAGFPIHIMSSMIPIFIMPIAVLDSIHIISEFFEKYQETRDRRRTVVAVMDELSVPMLYTSLTSAAGFASLALTPIPPVQVFGVFVAVGIMVAWLLTVTFIPAYIMFIRPQTLDGFGAKHRGAGQAEGGTVMSKTLQWLGGATYRRAKPILGLTMVVLVIAGVGISRININDNPIKWFAMSHPIREADRVLNKHFGGTYIAYLAMEYQEPDFNPAEYAAQFAARAEKRAGGIDALVARISAAAKGVAAEADSFDTFFVKLKGHLRPNPERATDEDLSLWNAVEGFLDRELDHLEFGDAPATFDGTRTPGALYERAKQFAGAFRAVLRQVNRKAKETVTSGVESRADFLDRLRIASKSSEGSSPAGHAGEPLEAAEAAAAFLISEERQMFEVFKRPDVLAHLKKLNAVLTATGIVGKTNSLVEIVETVNRDLHGGSSDYERIPGTKKAVGSCITQFQSSHRPQDLMHFVTPHDYQTAVMWVQLKSGDNKDMASVVEAVEKHIRNNPLPVNLRHRWFGLTYINVIWQGKMVKGMLAAFAGSFLVVFLLMTVLFRSALWGLLSMIPLTVTIAAIYGAVGLIGKDYDMPVAVLSSLTLGLAVDFAIHFLARSRSVYETAGNWRQAAFGVFGEPARAIVRNIVVIAAGFSPLLLASLVPYKTVGVLLATILLVSGACTLLLLPALIRPLESMLFPAARRAGLACRCATCIVSAVALALLVIMNVHHYLTTGWNVIVPVSLAIVVVIALGCRLLSQRRECRPPEHDNLQENRDEM